MKKKAWINWIAAIVGTTTLLLLARSAHADEWPAASREQTGDVLRSLHFVPPLAPITVHLGNEETDGFALTHGPDHTPCGRIRVDVVGNEPQLARLRLEQVARADSSFEAVVRMVARIRQIWPGYAWKDPTDLPADEQGCRCARMARLKPGTTDEKDGLVVQYTYHQDEDGKKVYLHELKVISRPEDKDPAK